MNKPMTKDNYHEEVEDIKVERARMQQAMDIAVDIFVLIQEKSVKTVMPTNPSVAAILLEKKDIEAILSSNKVPPLSDTRMTHIIQEIGDVIARMALMGGLDICGAWDFAHMIEHIMWDIDIPPIAPIREIQ